MKPIQLTYMLAELPVIAEKIISSSPHKTLSFYGAMGVGKTSLIKEVAKQIGVTEELSSPTYSIVNEYELPDGKLFHFDCYRLKSEVEALDIGIDVYFESDHWNLIEWPEKIKNLLPEANTNIEIIKNTNGSRTLKLTPVK
jgi:tRNA threonylcarbamoyladenosine biosynthesis protein TsaE